jgi:hypothetical protein
VDPLLADIKTIQSSSSILEKEDFLVGSCVPRPPPYVLFVLAQPSNRLCKVKYHPHEDWDFELDNKQAIDVSLVLPHYRARNQPVNHRMSMLVDAESEPVKLKIVSITTSSSSGYLTNLC